MGPYCKFCDRRCFLERVLKNGRSVLLATCDAGMAHDLKAAGETYLTAVNPITDPEAAAALRVRTCRKCQATIAPAGGGEWVVTGTGTSGDGLSYCPPDPDASHHGKHQPAAQTPAPVTTPPAAEPGGVSPLRGNA